MSGYGLLPSFEWTRRLFGNILSTRPTCCHGTSNTWTRAEGADRRADRRPTARRDGEIATPASGRHHAGGRRPSNTVSPAGIARAGAGIDRGDDRLSGRWGNPRWRVGVPAARRDHAAVLS